MGAPRGVVSAVPVHICAIVVFRFLLPTLPTKKLPWRQVYFFHGRLQNLPVGEDHGPTWKMERDKMELKKREVTLRLYPPQSGGPKGLDWEVLPKSNLPLVSFILLWPWPWPSRLTVVTTTARGSVCVKQGSKIVLS